MINSDFIKKLNKRIEIQEKNEIEDGFGSFIEEWTTIENIWAEIKPIGTYENFTAEKINEKITYIVTIRYFPNLKTTHRIKYKNRIFNIKGILNILEDNKILKIETEENLYGNSN